MYWNCPECFGSLISRTDQLLCAECSKTYPVIAEIPDFRSDDAAWIDFDIDRERALELDHIVENDGLDAALLNIFLRSRGFSLAKSKYRSQQVMSGVKKCEHQLDGWLSEHQKGAVLEIGSGPGQMIAAAAKRGVSVAGIDVSLEWLAFSKHWLRSLNINPVLACGMAEHLPVSSGSIQSIISLDVIEHVGDQNKYVGEIGRVLKPGGKFALVTPNRFSLSPEPHVGVWGVGYLPVPLQAAWVQLASGQSYEYTRLLSKGEARRLIKREMGVDAEFAFPPIAFEEIALFSKFKTGLAKIYNHVVTSKLLSPLMPLVGAYFRITGTKPKITAQ